MRAKSIGGSKSYRSGDPTPGSLPADEYVTPTGRRWVVEADSPMTAAEAA